MVNPEDIGEQMEVMSSDGEQIGTVDRVDGDTLKLAKNDPQAGGLHHWVPQSWVESVEDHVMLNKSASEVRSQWHDSAPASIDR